MSDVDRHAEHAKSIERAIAWKVRALEAEADRDRLQRELTEAQAGWEAARKMWLDERSIFETVIEQLQTRVTRDEAALGFIAAGIPQGVPLQAVLQGRIQIAREALAAGEAGIYYAPKCTCDPRRPLERRWEAHQPGCPVREEAT